MNRICAIILLMLLPALSRAQSINENGFPFIRNYNPDEYHAHAQNFALTHDANGFLYAGNFAGVLQFDGVRWRLIQTSNTSKVSALATDNQGVVYVGARGEIGYLKVDEAGGMRFVSLLDSSAMKLADFQDVLQIHCLKSQIRFVTENSIFTLENGTLTSLSLEDRIMGSFLVGETLYLQQEKAGFVRLNSSVPGTLLTEAVPGSSLFTSATPISAILSLPNGKQLLSTGTQGLFLFDGQAIEPFSCELNDFAKANPLNSLVLLGDETIAAGSSRSGVVIASSSGKIIQTIDKEASLQNSFVRAMHVMGNNSLWIALNNGISLVDIPFPLTYFDKNSGLEGSVNQIIRSQGDLYAATYQGLFVFDRKMHRFEPVPAIVSACWSLIEFQGKLIAATSQGIFSVQGKSATHLQDAFALSLAVSPKNPSSLFVGETSGLYSLSISGKLVKYNKINGLEQEIRDLTVDKEGTLWGVNASAGLFAYEVLNEKLALFNQQNALPENIGLNLHLVDNQLIVTSRFGLYSPDKSGQQFQAFRLMDTLMFPATEWFAHLYESPCGDIWITSGEETGIICLTKTEGKKVLNTELFKIVERKVINTIFSESETITWLGGPDGIIRYDAGKQNLNTSPTYSIIREIKIGSDSLIYQGNFSSVKKWSDRSLKIEYTNNSLAFEFAAPFYSSQSQLFFQYQLEGLDDTPGEWTTQAGKEYSNLPAGKYLLRVKVKNSFGNEAPEEQFAFQILAPWYLTVWAFALYIALFIVIVSLIVAARNRKLVREKKMLEEKIAERTAEVVQQKEEIENQSLELASKNDELEKINSAIKSINAEVNFENLLQSLLEKMKIIRATEKSIALVYDKNAEAFRFKAAYGWNIEQFNNLTLTMAQAEARYLNQAQEVFEDVFLKNDFQSFGTLESMKDIVKPKSMMILVIRVENRVEAFIIFENFTRENAFESKDISLIKNSKEHIISAIIRTRILEDLQLTLNDLKDTQDQLIQSEKLASLGQLTAGIAHEIQNPLNFVNNFSGLSMELADELIEVIDGIKDSLPKDKYEDVDDVIGMIKSNVTKINEHGKRVESIVKGMLQHSRGRSGEFEQLELNALVEEYVNLAYHGMKAKDKSFSTAIRTELDPAISKVSVMPQELSRVILNIVNNSCYALDQKIKMNIPDFKPEVWVITKKIKDKVEIRIRDNGTGIPKEIIEKVFNPFFTTKPTGQGTGLGLSMSFDIINKIHKGKLEVHSQDGDFTEFIITIPEIQN